MFLLVDCNNFYASCERVFRPDLEGRPVVVLSNNDGCIIARSNEAKALGYEMGDAWHLNRERLARDRVTVFSSNYALYGDMSARVVETLRPFADELETYSIDESFLFFAPGPDLAAVARRIRETVRRHTGIPVSVGVGPTKVLAKLANRMAKRRPESGGVFVMPEGEGRAELLRTVPTKDVWGVGRRLSEKLAAERIENAEQLSRLSDAAARSLLTVVGARLVMELRGVSCLEIEEFAPAKQALCCAKSFGTPLTTLEDLREPLASYVARLAEKLRAQRSVAGHIRVFLETNPFKTTDRQYSGGAGTDLPTATNYTPALGAAADLLLGQVWRAGYAYKRVGVMLLGLTDETNVQLGFDAPPPPLEDRRRRLMATVDRINDSLGRGSVRHGRAAAARPTWEMRQALRSPGRTTKWNDLTSATA